LYLEVKTCLCDKRKFSQSSINARSSAAAESSYGLIDLRPCEHDDGYMDDRSQIKVHTDERTQVHSAQSSLVVTHPSTNWG